MEVRNIEGNGGREQRRETGGRNQKMNWRRLKPSKKTAIYTYYIYL